MCISPVHIDVSVEGMTKSRTETFLAKRNICKMEMINPVTFAYFPKKAMT